MSYEKEGKGRDWVVEAKIGKRKEEDVMNDVIKDVLLKKKKKRERITLMQLEEHS